jgi:hypothetical protein
MLTPLNNTDKNNAELNTYINIIKNLGAAFKKNTYFCSLFK